MAVLAPKVTYTSSMGMGSSQTPSVGQFASSIQTHRMPVVGATLHAPFASPTESEFSEGVEGPDSVR